jgi:hypothetical protein
MTDLSDLDLDLLHELEALGRVRAGTLATHLPGCSTEHIRRSLTRLQGLGLVDVRDGLYRAAESAGPVTAPEGTDDVAELVATVARSRRGTAGPDLRRALGWGRTRFRDAARAAVHGGRLTRCRAPTRGQPWVYRVSSAASDHDHRLAWLLLITLAGDTDTDTLRAWALCALAGLPCPTLESR